MTMAVATPRSTASLVRKALLASRIWWLFARVHWGLARQPLPELVRRLSAPASRPSGARAPATLSRAVDRALRVRGRRPRCLINALVFYRLLRREGLPAELVIGLPADAPNHEAHAWVELDGRDVGPPPGQGRHVAMARYP
jgi:hypothetical protein